MKREEIKKIIKKVLKEPVDYRHLPKEIKDLVINPKYVPQKGKRTDEILYEMRYGKWLVYFIFMFKKV